MTSHNGKHHATQADIDALYNAECEDCRVEIAKTIKVLMDRGMQTAAIASGLANCLGSTVALVQPASTRKEFLQATIECTVQAVAGTLEAWSKAA